MAIKNVFIITLLLYNVFSTNAVLANEKVTVLNQKIPMKSGLWKNELTFSDGHKIEKDADAVEICTVYNDWTEEQIKEDTLDDEDTAGCQHLTLWQRGSKNSPNWKFGRKQICHEDDGSKYIYESWITPTSPHDKPLSSYTWTTKTVSVTKTKKVVPIDFYSGKSTWIKAQECE